MSLESLVVNLPRYQYAITVALPGPGPLADRLKHEGIKVEFVPLESWRWWIDMPTKALKFLLTLPLQVLSLMRWVRFLRRMRPDLIHFNINRLIEPVLAARLLGIPSVMHFRDIPSRMRYDFVLGSRVFYWLMNLADRWVANSFATGRDIQPHARHAVKVVPNAIDLRDFDENGNSAEGFNALGASQENVLRVVMIALLTRWKNHDGFIRLAKLLCSRRDDVLLLIAGSGDALYVAELRHLAETLGVAQKIQFLGHVSNIPALLRNVDVVVHTTEREPFGRVFLEAMASRRPVVAFDSGGAAEIVVNGETGLLFPSGNLEAMAEGVSRLLDNPDMRQRMGEAGRRRVEQSYMLDQHCCSVMQIYDDLMDKRNTVSHGPSESGSCK